MAARPTPNGEAAPAKKRGRAAALSPERRREVIVGTTLPLLLEHGRAVTTRQIAEATGVAEGTLFRAFPDKESLMRAVVEAALDPAPLDARLAEIDATLPLDERLVEAVRVLQERSLSLWRLASALGFTPGIRGIAPGRRRLMTDLGSLVALFEADREQLRFDPASNARRLRALAVAASHPVFAEEPLSPEEIVSLFLDGVRRPAGAHRARPRR